MAVGVSRTARDIAFTLEVKSTKIFENIFLNNGILAALGMNGRVKIQKGGNRFDERAHLGQNSTVAQRSKYDPIPLDNQNNWQTAQYGQSVADGAAVVNLVEEDQNAGDSRISSLADGILEDALQTFPNKISDAIMKATPTDLDPDGISVIQATAFGSQTGSVGGIARSDHNGIADLADAWQNQYRATAIADVSAAAGIQAITKFAWQCSPGGSGINEQPDIGLTTVGVFAMFNGSDVLRRYSVNDKLLKLGFDNIMVNRAAIMADRSVATGRLYLLNTNYLRLQVLAGSKTKQVGQVITVGEGKQAIPLQVREPIESDNHLAYSIKMYIVYNLTWGGLRQHGLQVSITEA